MSLPDVPSASEHSMPRLPAPAVSVTDFFSRALSSFRSSGSAFQVICTAAPTAAHPDSTEHGQPAPLPPRARPHTLIVLDSSFNPPTRAHQRMATSAIHDLCHSQGREAGMLRLLLLLSVNNADKGEKPAAFDRRLAMMWAFSRDVQRSLPGGLESGVPGLSIDLGLAMAPYFHEKSAALADADFYRGGIQEGAGEMEQLFLVGYDTLVRIFNPKYYVPPGSHAGSPSAGAPPMQKALDPFFERAKLRVTMRTGDEWGDEKEQKAYLEAMLEAEGLSEVGGSTHWGSRIEMCEGGPAGADVISSTYARTAAKDRDASRLAAMVSPEVRWWIEQVELYAH